MKRKVPDELLCEYFFPNGLKAHSYKKTMLGELLTKLEELYHTIYNRTLHVTTPISTLCAGHSYSSMSAWNQLILLTLRIRRISD